MKSILFIGILMIIAAIFFAFSKYSLYQIEKNGVIVKMQIVRLPTYCGLTKGNYNMRIRYNDVLFIKRIPTGYCNEHKVGEYVDMKYLEGKESVLFPGEKMKGQFISIAIFFGVGLLAVVSSFLNDMAQSSKKI